MADSDTISDLASRDFLRAAAARDVQQGRYDGQVVTRFPPEPNGYPHIGHAKAIVVNFGLARDFGGRCHLRMDDTNPTTESMEFAESMKQDVRWLGFDWGEHLYFASDMYDDMYQLAVRLIDRGLAYIDEQDEEQIRAGRGTVTEAGTNSPFRDRPAEQSRDLFARMRAGEFADGSMVLRAKIDMAAANMLLRDPIIYRIRHAHHYRTGDAWCIYPMYDFAHCLEDALEGVTHSVCTLEFQDNRALYDWFIEKTGVVPPERAPKQYEMARLEMTYVITSKRRLKQLVDEGRVDGWDDPRMPTLAGLRRRGVPPEALVSMVERVGIAKTNSQVEIELLEHSIRDHLNHTAPRRMGVVEPLEAVISNWDEGELEWVEADSFPPDVGAPGSRRLPFGKRLWIERSDFALQPEKGFKRLSPGAVVRLRNGYVVECIGVRADADGTVLGIDLRAFRDVERGSAPDGVKVKGTIHWVEASTAVAANFRLYDRMFTVPSPLADPHGRSFHDLLNPDSLVVARGFVEPAMDGAPAGTRVQLERTGYFVVDQDGTDADGRLLLNRTLPLKDSWARRQDAGAPADEPPPEPPTTPASTDDRRKRKKRPASEVRAEARATDPTLAQGHARLLALGLADDDADVLSGDRDSLALFDAAHAAHDDAAAVASTIVNDLRGLVEGGELGGLPFQGGALGRLVALQADGTLTGRSARRVLELMVAEGGEPADLVARHQLASMDDEQALRDAIDKVLADHPVEVERYRSGEVRLQGFFMGQLMRATRGKADPADARRLLLEHLGR